MSRLTYGLIAATAACTLAAISACSGSGHVHEDEDTPEGMAYVYRHSVMELISAKNLTLREMVRGERDVDEAVFKKSASDLAVLAGMILEGYQVKGISDESLATPEIWDNWSDFQSKADNLIQAATALSDAADQGGFAAAKDLHENVQQTCSACHRPYRASTSD